MKDSLTRTSKFLSLILRHQPEAVDMTLDTHGWADVQTLIRHINLTGTYYIDMSVLEEIVRTDNKQRYSFNADKTKIRANQGHSIPVDVELKAQVPPESLYHGTAEKYLDSIYRQGLLPQGRLYVHLSGDAATALTVGKRHGKPHVFRIPAVEMHRQGYIFYLSENQVWLTNHVPAAFLQSV